MKAQLCRSSGDAARGTVHDIGQEAAPRRIVGQRTHQTVGFVLSPDGMHQLWATVGEPCWGGSDGSPASIAVRFLFYFVEESPHPGIPVAWVKCRVRVGQQLRSVFLRDGLHLLQGAWPRLGCRHIHGQPLSRKREVRLFGLRQRELGDAVGSVENIEQTFLYVYLTVPDCAMK